MFFKSFIYILIFYFFYQLLSQSVEFSNCKLFIFYLSILVIDLLYFKTVIKFINF